MKTNKFEQGLMRKYSDPYGQQLLAGLRGEKTYEIIERDDGYIDAGSDRGTYFEEYSEWPEVQKRAIGFATGRILDVGCGAGRHALYLQGKGFDVTGIDNSPGAVQVCKSRGLRKVLLRPISEIGKFRPGSFDTVLMLGNNFGLLGGARRAKVLLKKLHRITSPHAQIIAENRNPYLTKDSNHLRYHRRNIRRGRLAGQLRIRVRFKDATGPWFDYLFVSPSEMRMILEGTGWQISEIYDPAEVEYIAIITKQK